MRALKFMKENRNDAALSLLTELLEAKVIDEVSHQRLSVLPVFSLQTNECQL